MSFLVVIPARYAATRLPRKPLLDIAGKPMVVRTAERAMRSRAREVWIATDHPEIEAAARAHGMRVVMTRADHASGTDRLAEVAELLRLPDDQIIVNVQGDEPLIEPELIDRVATDLAADGDAAIATAAHPIAALAEFLNPNVVKVVCDARGGALYFSRAPIPFARDAFAAGVSCSAGGAAPLPPGVPALRHIGIYAYRAYFLRRYAALAPSPLESCEALEQLRALAAGYRIRVAVAARAPEAGVDTAEDLERVRKRFDRAGEYR